MSLDSDQFIETELWEPLIRSIQLRQCVPFLGAAVARDCLPDGGGLARQLAAEFGYPFDDPSNLQSVSQFGATTRRDPSFPKGFIQELIGQAQQAYAGAGRGVAPRIYELLADLDAPMYITTNYDSLLERVFRARSIEPMIETCRWNDELVRDLGPYRRYDSTARRPVVFHLHGELDRASSMVVTEDDYVNFIVQLALEQKTTRKTMMWPPVVQALSSKKLLFIGYSLKDLNFRVLMRYLFSHYKTTHSGLHVSIQLQPELDGMTADQQATAQRYFQHYFQDSKVRLHWSDGTAFLEELTMRLRQP